MGIALLKCSGIKAEDRCSWGIEKAVGEGLHNFFNVTRVIVHFESSTNLNAALVALPV